jgi:hypothetical protein
MSRDGKSGKHLLRNPAFAQYTPTPEEKRRINSLRDFARMLACEIRSSTPAGPNQTLAIRHVEDALMRANKAILEDAQDTAEQSWIVYFDLEDSGSYVFQDGELFREEPGGTYPQWVEFGSEVQIRCDSLNSI